MANGFGAHVNALRSFDGVVKYFDEDSKTYKGVGIITDMVFFVDPYLGDDDNDGFAPGTAVKTITKAIEKCQSGRGDTILILPGRDADGALVAIQETVILDKNNVTIMGVGGSSAGGRGGPHWESAGAGEIALVVKARCCRVTGIYFNGQADAACIAIWRDPSLNAYKALIDRCEFFGLGVSGLRAIQLGYPAETGGSPHSITIRNNWFEFFQGGAESCAIAGVVQAVAYPFRMIIEDNYFAECDNYMDFYAHDAMILRNVLMSPCHSFSPTKMIHIRAGTGNVISGNFLPGDYSLDGGRFKTGTNNQWAGNICDDTSAAEVGDNGLSISEPTAA